MKEKKPFVCEDCGEILTNIFDFAEHNETVPHMTVHVGEGFMLDLWSLMEGIFMLSEEGRNEDIQETVEGIAAALYSSASGVLREQWEEAIVEVSLKNIDEQIKELLDDETNNDN
jgi:hypothetical protein